MTLDRLIKAVLKYMDERGMLETVKKTTALTPVRPPAEDPATFIDEDPFSNYGGETVFCHKGSYAEKYCIEHDIRYIHV